MVNALLFIADNIINKFLFIDGQYKAYPIQVINK